MNKKQRDRKNKKRAIKVGEWKREGRTVRYVDVQFLMTVGGKTFAGKRFHYGRGRTTSACDLEQLASIIMMWEHTVNFGSTYADEFLKEVEGKIANRSGLTADQIFTKHWVNYRETIEEDFERKNKGVAGEWFCEHENDCLKNSTGMWLDSFFREPLPIKLAILYGIYRLGYETDGFDGMKKEIEEIPQYIKDIVDGIIASSRKDKED